ncbi:3'-5' RNA helicase YTHDC2-like [Teleopsis dalmanni]|uniref:3'-5' RNA helicase YTHDC2-like n=1 Tax=Teleopsis dalmanni TaxID=139649 RepID=UPI0018CCB230|nr:3'-5' RNA helicase YTHDC2-like [Teleopsis dalmanni]
MENRMNRSELQDVLAAVGIEVQPRATTARMRQIFADNRSTLEDCIARRLSNVEGLSKQTAVSSSSVVTTAVTTSTIAAFGDSASRESVQPIQQHKIHFQDIEHAIIKFSGEDRTYSVHDFFRHLEQIFEQVGADDLFKLLALRNSLTGAARLLLTRGYLTYEELKQKLIGEFGRTISRQEVYQALRMRTKKPTESVHRYAMEMESIAHRSDVMELELVAFILEGLSNRIPDFVLFNTAKNLNELKGAVAMFEQRQAVRGVANKQDANRETKTTVKLSSGYFADNPTQNANRCFNCSRFGHRRPTCLYEERPINGCYNCWKSGHNRKSCPNPKYTPKLKSATSVAMTMDCAEDTNIVDDVASALEAMNYVSVVFDDTKCGRNITTTVLYLFDTGSSISLIHKSSVPVAIQEETDETQYYGLGKFKIKTYGITPLMAACKCNFPEYVEFFVKNQANVLLQDSQGYTAVEYAANFSDRACTEILERTEFCLQQQLQFTDEDVEKTQLLTAYQKQSNYDNEVDHDLILSLLEGLYRGTHPGAILVFLPGYNDIVQQRDLINSTLPPGTYKLCILHGQMDSQDQIEALQRHNQRKIILSTNIGQTSITIPDLVYIIDSGKIKMKTYDSITESSQLQSVWISKADANQRSGRAGRTQNGICYRLYSKAKYEFMPQFCIPEFMRIPLAEICLYAKTFDKNTDCQTYLQRALNPPSKVCIQNAVKKLQILQVFNDDESVTDLGKQLVEIPLDVQLGICLLYGVFFKCFDPVLTIVAYHSVKDPFLLPTDRSAQGQASYQRKLFSAQSFSDQLGVLELYKAYSTVRNNKKRCFDFCSKNSLSYSAMEMFCATRRQISDLMVQKYRLGHNATLFNDDWEMVKCCLAAGLYPNIAVLDRYKNELSSSVEKKLIVQRTSALNPPGQKNLKDFIHQLPHDWIIFYEKSRVGKLCSINMNTVISPVVVALHCGRYCNINDYGGENSDKSDDEADFEVLSKEVRDLALTDDQQTVSFILDNWIHFEMNSKDAKSLKTLRSAIKTEFITFLRRGFIESSTTAVFWLQKLLHTLDQFTIS